MNRFAGVLFLILIATRTNASSPVGAEAIALKLVSRLEARDLKQNQTAPKVYDYRTNSMIQIQFSDVHLPAILRSGFLNQHQTNTSQGALVPKLRCVLEDQLIGLHLTNGCESGMTLANSVRPKYAYLSFKADSDGQHHNVFGAYGNIVAVLKDRLKSRTTFTPVDSLDGSFDVDGHFIQDSIRAYSFAYQGPIRRLNPKSLMFSADDSYWEAQVWGPVTVQKDVDYFLIDCPPLPEIDDFKPVPVSRDAVRLLLSTHIPTYRCAVAKDKSHYRRLQQVKE